MRKTDSKDAQESLFPEESPLSEEEQLKSAVASDHITVPMPDEIEKMPLTVHFNREKMKRIRCGFVPIEMEDKWFIYYENGKLFFHRSWTGYCIFQLCFTEDTDGGVTAHTLVINRNSEQYKGPVAKMCWKTARELIKNFLI